MFIWYANAFNTVYKKVTEKSNTLYYVVPEIRKKRSS